MFDKLVDTIIYATPTVCDIISKELPAHPIAIVILTLGMLCVAYYLAKTWECSLSQFVSVVRAVCACLSASYSAAGHPVLIFVIWISAVAAGVITLVTRRNQRIQRIMNGAHPTTAVAKIGRRHEIMRSSRLFYRSPPKKTVPTYYIRII